MPTAAEPKPFAPQPPEIPVFLKCACAHCGHLIEYNADRASKIIECPKCKQKSQLPENEKMWIVEQHGPPIPATKVCPICGTTQKFWERKCTNCETGQRRKKTWFWTLCTLAVVAALGGTGYAAYRHNARLQTELAAQKASQPVYMLLEQPSVRRPKSLSDLVPQKFWLEQKHESDFVMAVGDVLNDSGNTHYRLKLELTLVDAAGAAVGSVSDDSAQLGPRQSWHVVIPVINARAKNVKFGSIKEDQ